MKVIILSAGQGSRLFPLTTDRPKCLLPLNDNYTVLCWQLEKLEQAGAHEIVVVTGFQSEKIDALIREYNGNITVRTRFNPFYNVSDNLATLWVVRDEIRDGERFAILNGDTIFSTDVAERLFNNANASINLTTCVKETYDADDMKVIIENGRLRRVSKQLSLEDVNAESIGFMLFQGKGITAFKNEIETIMRTSEGLKRFYLSVIDALAHTIDIASIETPISSWQEIDYPDDYTKAREAIARWILQSDQGASTALA